MFVFKLDQMEVARDMIANPRVVVKERLSDFVGSALPKSICDIIQHLVGVKSMVLVPIMIDGEFWAGMLFFLENNVPTDILEMVSAHCATAMKNVHKTESLEKKNRELSAINAIMTRTSGLQSLEEQLNGVIGEVLGIFSANAAAIYLTSSDGEFLELAAQRGMPETMKTKAQRLPIRGSVIGSLLFSEIPILKGDLNSFADTITGYESMREKDSLPFVAARIDIKRQARGVLTLVRRRPECIFRVRFYTDYDYCQSNRFMHRKLSASTRYSII